MKNHFKTLILVAGFSLLTLPNAFAGVIAHVTYQFKEQTVAKATYVTYNDWQEMQYWSLPGKRPDHLNNLKLAALKDNELRAELKGKVKLSIVVVDDKDKGTIEIENLTFKRKSATDTNWFLTEESSKRVIAALKEKATKNQ